MTAREVEPKMQRFTAWLVRFRNAVFFVSLAVLVGGSFLASGLSLRSDLSSLLPPSKRSVQDLEILRGRARSFGNALVMIDATSVELRARAAVDLEQQLRKLDPSLVATVSTDDNLAARFGWQHRFLFAELADLAAAKAALERQITKAKLKANPLYIDLDDEDDDGAGADEAELAALQRRLDEAERLASLPPLRLSPDGKSQLIALTVTFPASDIGRDRQVMGQLRAMGRDLEIRHPGTTVQFAGSINISIFEHDSVIAGMAMSAVITILLVALALLLYFRAVLPVLGALFALMVGVAATLGITALTIGHLNLLSAFLTAIVVGNGINPGLIVLARTGDEIRDGHEPQVAITRALRGSLHGTLAASFTSAVAYGALIVTDFRGFRHFGIIGGVGMIACWITAYTVLPVTLSWLAGRGRLKARRPPAIGSLLGKLAPRHPARALTLGAFVTLISIVIATRFVVGDPFQRDWRDLQADGGQISAQHVVDAQMTARFSADTLKGHSFQLAIAVPRADQVRDLVASLRAQEASRPAGQELFTDIKSIEDLVPPDQDKKLILLGQIRELFHEPALQALSEDELARLSRLRPPEDITPITVDDVPAEISRAFVEQNGSVGRLVYVKGSPRFSTWDVADRVEFAREVRRLKLPPDVVIGGEPLVIADIVSTMEHDTPIMVLVSLLGSVFAVWLVVGLRRHGRITLLCGATGVLLMIALCALAGLRVHFLDLIALPITIGIGIDYAVNLATRDRESPGQPASKLLATAGAAVLLCSFTTTVGYASLLLSSNGGVRAFGLAAILGEIACIVMALLLAPSLLVRGAAREQR